jgi:DnaJ-class molecular chaperone
VLLFYLCGQWALIAFFVRERLCDLCGGAGELGKGNCALVFIVFFVREQLCDLCGGAGEIGKGNCALVLYLWTVGIDCFLCAGAVV